jgi:hypothetical protein
VAVYSAQTYVLDFLQGPLEQAVEKDNLRVGGGWGRGLPTAALMMHLCMHQGSPTGPTDR